MGHSSSYFNGGSCYKYNFKGIGYIKLSASVYRNVWKLGLGDSMIVIHGRDSWSTVVIMIVRTLLLS